MNAPKVFGVELLPNSPASVSGVVAGSLLDVIGQPQYGAAVYWRSRILLTVPRCSSWADITGAIERELLKIHDAIAAAWVASEREAFDAAVKAANKAPSAPEGGE